MSYARISLDSEGQSEVDFKKFQEKIWFRFKKDKKNDPYSPILEILNE